MAQHIVVETIGGKIRGIVEGGVRVFKGIRCGGPVDGERRFALIAIIVAVAIFAGGRVRAQVPAIRPGEQLTLKKAIDLALRFHPKRLEVESEAKAAGERVGEARAGLLPQLYGVANYLRSTDNGIGDATFLGLGYVPRITGRDRDAQSGASQSSSTGNNYLGALAASQYLFDFGRVRGVVGQRKDEASAEQERLRLTDLDLIFQATQRYFGLLAAQQLVRVFEKAVAQRQEHLHEAQVKAQADLRPQIDVFTAQAALQRARVQLLNARNGGDEAKVALDNAMGLGIGAPDYSLAGVLTYGKIEEAFDSYLKSAFQSRPDLMLLVDQARAAGARIQEFRSDYFPSVYAAANYSAIGTGLPAANNFDVGLIITWPIFNGLETTHQVEEAKLRQKAIKHAIEDLRQRIFLQVKTAYLDWGTSLQRIHRAEKTLAASTVELELAEKRYEAGLGNIIELTDAQQRYTNDDAQYVEALYAFSTAKAALERAAAR